MEVLNTLVRSSMRAKGASTTVASNNSNTTQLPRGPYLFSLLFKDI